MKLSVNLTTSPEDLDRFASREELEELLRGFDGVELMYYGEDERKIIPPERVVGFHMQNHNYWLDFWRREEEALRRV